MARQHRHPGIPLSLVHPEADLASERRAVAGASAANGPPTEPTQGFHTQGRRWLHIVVSLPDAATSLTWSLWTWNSVSELWCLDTRLGTAGVVPLDVSDADNPQNSIVEIAGLDRVYIELATFAGAFTAGADVWLAASGIVENG